MNTHLHMINHLQLSRKNKPLLFRNVARQTVSTHYVFPSDIELYPRFRFCALLLMKSKHENTLSDVMKWPHKSLILAQMTMMILKTKTPGFDSTFPPVRILFQPSWRWFGNMVLYFRKASKHSKAFCETWSSNYILFTQNNFSPRVFVNSIFEIEKNHSLPETKTELLE